MKSYLNLLSITLVTLGLLVFISGCATNSEPPTTNTTATPNKDAATPQPPTVASNPPEGWMDDVRGELTPNGTIGVSGWAADPEDGSPVKRVEIFIDDNVVGQADLGTERTDVPRVTGQPKWLHSGWGALVKLTNVTPGRHKITAVAYDSGGTKRVLNGGRDIEVVAK